MNIIWHVRRDKDKSSAQQRSEEIKQKFKSHIGFIVKAKPGFGNLNDGNTVCWFFMKLSGEITGLSDYEIGR